MRDGIRRAHRLGLGAFGLILLALALKVASMAAGGGA